MTRTQKSNLKSWFVATAYVTLFVCGLWKVALVALVIDNVAAGIAGDK